MARGYTPGPPFIRRHVTATRGRPVSIGVRRFTLSSASSALGIFNLITNCPYAPSLPPSVPAPSPRFRFFLVPFSAVSACASLCHSFSRARDPMKNSRRSIATELLAGRLYLWRSFSWRSRPGRAQPVRHFSLSLSLARSVVPFLASLPHLANYLLIPRLILPMLSMLPVPDV